MSGGPKAQLRALKVGESTAIPGKRLPVRPALLVEHMRALYGQTFTWSQRVRGEPVTFTRKA